MTQIKFGFIIPDDPQEKDQQATFVENLNRALDLVSGHFDSAWSIDHLQHVEFESFTALAYLAALHPQLNFGHSVICQSFRNPALVAKMGATLQVLSQGRFSLGIGAGWNEEEYLAYGYDFPPAKVRVEQLEEALQIIKAMWTEKSATFQGKHYRVVNAGCQPKPDPLPPIIVGAFKPKMLRITARYADEWNVSSTGIRKYERMVKDFERACAEVKRSPSDIRRSWSGGCVCRTTQAAAKRIAGDRYDSDILEDDFDFVGTPAQISAHMRAFMDLGITTFMLDCGGFPDLTTLQLLISEVLPAVKN